MVYFKDKSSPSGEDHLIILDNQNQPLEKGTMSVVYAPLISGRNVSPWPRLTNSSPLSEWYQETSLSKNVKAWILRANHHEPPRHQPSDDFAHLCTLGRSIIEGDAKWDGDLRFTGEFRYTKEYWEWTEDVLSRCGDRLRHLEIYDAVYASMFTYDHNSDIVKAFCERWCPLTNTLLTSAGEMFISLWDLHELVGLPMTGCLYDEVVPSALELTGVDEKRERFIPRSFLSKKTTKYHPPPPRKEKKSVRPKSTHNPLGDIATHERWSTAEDTLFAKLCIERSLKEEVYLAAYLACGLCDKCTICHVFMGCLLIRELANGRSLANDKVRKGELTFDPEIEKTARRLRWETKQHTEEASTSYEDGKDITLEFEESSGESEEEVMAIVPERTINDMTSPDLN
ncbi:hypothetical protein Sango_2307500 [Sesamum angolense]|uniref:Aminotransferase-like plant mobile domain-containing protein n=1 Tax=Sesamum angolense TaxID=2727404 RepID=A0AAE2BLG9_9LAMI|nr:hypothetical protein Sango_2307500 [Sesamum angolense]